jgi:Predicted oxidoreductases of the aldo/keto reductase family
MKRRDFIKTGLFAGGAIAAAGLTTAAPTGVRRATDMIELGPDKIRLSRLAMGTGTRGRGGSTNQTRQLGIEGLANLLEYGVDNGLNFFDTADAYGSHPHVKEALKRVPREKVVIMTKTRSRTAEQMKADLDRFRQELGTDYIDIVLLHAETNPNWPEIRAGAMEVLSEAREKGIVKTHGISCHSIGTLRTAAKTDWVKVDLARINPEGLLMDADPATVISVLREMKAAGKGVIGMKILGEGQLRDRPDEMLRFVLSLDCVDCFTIGAENRDELADLLKRIPANSVAA